VRDDGQLERDIAALLADSQYEGHPLRDALAALLQRYHDQLASLERLTSISDGYQSALRDQNLSVTQRYQKQIRQLQKIVRISDHYQEMLRELNDALKIASTQDPLTGLPNRRLMLERLNSEAALSDRQGTTFSIALIDIDYFKQINDSFGHDVGDTVLVEMASALTTGLRAYDICARWGGEEFMVLLPETPGDIAIEIARRLQVAVAVASYDKLPATTRPTISAGLAERPPATPIADTMKRADQALYRAKNAGRNSIVLAGYG
jgi:diguanylate cyclase (GGDEF)-like protein